MMGSGRGVPLPIWLLIVAATCFQQYAHAQTEEGVLQTDDPEGQQNQELSSGGIPRGALRQIPKPLLTAHNDQVCSTWGNSHYKTFDGVVFHFPGTCNYLLVSNCKSAYESFNIQIRREVVNNIPTITRIIMVLEGVIIQFKNGTVIVNDKVTELPYSHSGIQMDRNGVYLRVTYKDGMDFTWNEEDAIMVELGENYENTTCGLCGNFNDIPKDEFLVNGFEMTPQQYGNFHKLNDPTEECEDMIIEPLNNCTGQVEFCESVMRSSAFAECNTDIDVQPYIEACAQDMCRCNNESQSFCLCNTFAEYSRQCSHADSKPSNWRKPDLCPITCPFNMVYNECSSPCVDTCSNNEQSALCGEHCSDGCYCPEGTVYDDITNSGCMKQEECPCSFNGKTYARGSNYTTACQRCTCGGGTWECEHLPCVGTCSVDGGSHIKTFDETFYNFHGDCGYVLAKDSIGNSFSVMAELRICGRTESETCMKSVSISLNGGDKTFFIKPDCTVLMNMVHAELPIVSDGVTVFQPSSSVIILDTNVGLQVEIEAKPFMQARIRLQPHLEGKTAGLCGNFNKDQADDFRTLSGVVEATGASFANNWKTQSDCPNVKNLHEDPCASSVQNAEYAQHHCEMLSDPLGPFEPCHAFLAPAPYEKNCMFDTCNCEKTEDCMCAMISSYVRACAAKEIFLEGWRSEICGKYSEDCPATQTYTYSTHTCQATCRSLSEPDNSCGVKILPVDGCVCPEGMYLDESGKCVEVEDCNCYYKGSSMAPGEVVHENKAICTCSLGKVSCLGVTVKDPECEAPKVYFDCANVSTNAKGSECQKSCQTFDVECFSTHCVSGCVCPEGMVLDGKGGCIQAEACPCLHNDAEYQPGEEISVSCNTCTCKNRMWQCTDKPCFGTCSVYGDGHYITLDSKHYSFNGDCQYTLAQDYCGNSTAGTFRVITENIPCGTTGTTCSKSIRVFLGGNELMLHEEHIDVVQRDSTVDMPYNVRSTGIYMVIESKHGMALMWDRRTSMFLKLSSKFKGKVCGLCGNFDSNGINDFTTRSQSVVVDVLEFANSWKANPNCPDALEAKDPCTANPYRKAWSQKQCSIIKSNAFSTCHSQVDPSKYYEACVTDSCACDTGGDCECFCTAVAAYAQACSEVGVCIHWRTPDICPLFCDFYNPDGDCEWHYKPCGAPCMKTCANPGGKCLYELPGLEGCYPSCPEDRPYFDEQNMACTANCGCYDNHGNLYRPGSKTPSVENCMSCTCIGNDLKCNYDLTACFCYYGGKKYKYGEEIYRTGDNLGGCFVATCAANGTINRQITECTTTAPTTAFTFTTGTPTSSHTSAPPTPTVCVHEVCSWTEWLDHSYPGSGPDDGDYETLELMKEKGGKVCKTPKEVRCRAANFQDSTLEEVGQVVECTPHTGLKCNNKDQKPAPKCENYQVSFLCCSYVSCGSTPSSTTTSSTTTGTTGAPSIPTGTEPTTTTSSTTSVVTGTTPSPSTTSETSTITESTTTPSTTTVSEKTSPPATVCEPICKWSNWFDDKEPTSDPDDGDSETFENIIASGRTVCTKSEKISNIECRAVNVPEKDIATLGQNVKCDVTTGLVCNNADQTGEEDGKKCSNYKMRVLCCDTTHCATTSATTETTAPPTSAVTETTTGTTATPSTPGTVPTTTTGTTGMPSTPGTEQTTTGTPGTPSTPGTEPMTSTGTTGAPTTTENPTTTTGVTGTPLTPGTEPTTTTGMTGTPPTPGTEPTTTTGTTGTPSTPGSEPTTTAGMTEIPPTPGTEPTTTIGTTGLPSTPGTEPTTTTGTTGVPPSTGTEPTTTIGAIGTPSTPGTEPTTTTGTTGTPSIPGTEPATTGTPGTPSTPGTEPTTTTGTTGTPSTPGTEPTTTTGTTGTSSTPGTESTTTIGTTGTPSTPGPEPTTITVTPRTPSTPGTELTTTTGPTGTPSTPGTEPTTTTGTTGTSSTAGAEPTTTTGTAETPSTPGTEHTTTTGTAGTPATSGTEPTTTTGTTGTPSTPGTESTTATGTTGTPSTPGTESTTTIATTGAPSTQGTEPTTTTGTTRATSTPGTETTTVAITSGTPSKPGTEPTTITGMTEKPSTPGTEPTTTTGTTGTPSTPGTEATTITGTTGTPSTSGTEPTTTTGTTGTPSTPGTEPSTTTGTTGTLSTPGTEPTTTTGTTETPSTPGTEHTTTTGKTGTTTTPGTEPTTTTGTTGTPSTPGTEPTTTTGTTGTPLPPGTEPTTGITGTSSTPGTESTTTPSTTTVSEKTSPPATVCEPICKWSNWFDDKEPTSDPDDGDSETFENIIASGRTVCTKSEKISNIECRAVNVPEKDIATLGQNVKCDVTTGLVCNNADQTGEEDVKKCDNYKMRVLCCDTTHCATTSATTTETPSTSGSESTTTTGTTETPSTPGTGQTTATGTTGTPSTPGTQSTTTIGTTGTPSTPSTEPTTTTGTTETPSTSGSESTTTIGTTETPSTPGTEPTATTGTTGKPGTEPTTTTGSTGTPSTPGTEPTTTTGTTGTPMTPGTEQTTTTGATGTPSTPGTEPTTTTGTTGTPLIPGTESTMTTGTAGTPSTPVTEPTTTTGTTETPSTSGSESTTTTGTTETRSTPGTEPTTSTGSTRTPLTPGTEPTTTTSTTETLSTPSTELTTTSGTIGTIRTPSTPGTEQTTTTASTGTPSTPGIEPTTTMGTTGTPLPPGTEPTTSTGTTGTPSTPGTEPTTTTGTTETPSTPGTETTTTTGTTEAPSTPGKETSTTTGTIGTGSTPGTEPSTTIGTTTTIVTGTTTSGSTTSETTTLSTTTPSSATVPETTSPLACEPLCKWSDWFDDKEPSSEPDDGDSETFENIIASGKTICTNSEKISDIECRAVNFPEKDIAEIGQIVKCNVTTGLVCNNADQTGEEDVKKCNNYKMRVLCCDTTHCATTVATTTTETTAPPTSAITETTTATTGPTGAPSTSTGTTPTTTTSSTTPSTEETTSIVTESTATPSIATEPSTEETTTKSPVTSPESTATPTTSIRTPSSPPPTTETSTSTTTSVTTTCHCKVGDNLIPPGGVIYNTTDNEGCLYFAICGADCTPVRSKGPCITTGTPPPQVTSPITTVTPVTPESTAETTTPSTTESPAATTTPSTSGSLPTTHKRPNGTVEDGCDSVDPYREVGETWEINKCTNATCELGGIITLQHVECPLVKKITCDGGLAPKQVYDQKGCCFQYECDSCVGPDGKPRMPGESWTSNCQKCSCDMKTISVQCEEIKCQESTPPACDKEGFELVEAPVPDNSCCTEMTCKCNPILCNPDVKKCEIGFTLSSILSAGDCCAKMECVPEKVCVFNNVKYQPGSNIPQIKGTCQECECTDQVDPDTQLLTVKCQDTVCLTDCAEGYEYTKKPEECCGKCVQTRCVMKTQNNETKVLEVGEIWNPSGDNCSMQYECEKVYDRFVVTSVKRVCPALEPADCPNEYRQKTSDGCCEICKLPLAYCTPQPKATVLSHGTCNTTVELSVCEGLCSSSSGFSSMTRAMEHKCSCCQELKKSNKTAELVCEDGTSISFSYVSVDECDCVGTVCIPQEGTWAAQQENSRRRRR